MNTTIGRSPTLVPTAAQFDVWTTYDWRNGLLITELAVFPACRSQSSFFIAISMSRYM